MIQILPTEINRTVPNTKAEIDKHLASKSAMIVSHDAKTSEIRLMITDRTCYAFMKLGSLRPHLLPSMESAILAEINEGRTVMIVEDIDELIKIAYGPRCLLP